MKLLLQFVLLFAALPAWAQTVINCGSGFNTPSGGFGSGGSPQTCGVNTIPYPAGQPFGVTDYVGPNMALSNSPLILIPYPGGHTASTLMYQTAVNNQAFTTSFTYIADGKNAGIVWNNTNNQGPNSYQGAQFAGGAGCEAGIYQFFTSPELNNVFALELDSSSALTNVSPYTFTYSSVQLYTANQSPCIPPYGPDTTPSKISTSPVPLGNSPATSPLTTNGDLISVQISYDGSNFNLCLYDVTAANGSCSSATSGTGTYFQHTWTSVNIPTAVDGNTSYVGLAGGTNSDNAGALQFNSWAYTVVSASDASQPSCAPTSGSSGSPITVTCTNPNSGTTIMCYTENGATPATNGAGTGCTTGTSLSGSSNNITISTNVTTLNVIAGTSTLSDSPVSSYGSYTITGNSTASSYGPGFKAGAGLVIH